jgi:hypothetical protein
MCVIPHASASVLEESLPDGIREHRKKRWPGAAGDDREPRRAKPLYNSAAFANDFERLAP